MNTVRHIAAAAALLLSCASAFAGVTVTYTQPEQFSDVPFAPWERERVLKELTRHFDKMAKTLPAGQKLNVNVTDVDLAGYTWPHANGAHDLRVMNGRADWPKMSITYTVTQDGQVLRTGEEHLSSMNYLHNINRYARNEELRYEKQMLDAWFKERIVAVR